MDKQTENGMLMFSIPFALFENNAKSLPQMSSIKSLKIKKKKTSKGLEADGVLHLNDGRYALIEFKLGQTEVDDTRF